MKKQTLGFLFFLLSFVMLGQSIEIGQNFYFKSDLGPISATILKQVNTKNDSIINSSTNSQIEKGHRIRVVKTTDDKIYFKYLKFTKPNDTLSSNEKAIKPFYKFNREFDDENQIKIFSMSKVDFEKYTSNLYNLFRGFKYGAYTVPIRLRSKDNNFEFNSNLSIGANIISSFGLRTKEHATIDFSIGIGITKVALNKENSDLGEEGLDFENVDVLSPAAFTISFGAHITLAKNVNFGIYYGWDKLSSADNKAKWIYNKKPWLGIGLNVGFSGKANDSSSSSENQ